MATLVNLPSRFFAVEAPEGAMAALWTAELPGVHESLYLLVALNFVFSTLVSLFVTYPIAGKGSTRRN